MRKLLPATLVVCGIVFAAPAPARADFGLGLFLGDPTGLDLKIGLGNRSALDLLFGVTTLRSDRESYGHVTYLVTPLVGQGRTVLVPLRLGIGAALYGPGDDLQFAVRAPLEVGLRWRNSPLEIYGEIGLALTLFRHNDNFSADLQGGVGLRLYL